MVIALHAAQNRFISASLPDDAPVTRARVEITDSIVQARRFADAAALTAYLTARGEPATSWFPLVLP